MIHGRPSLSSLTRALSDVCMGRQPADLLITGGRLVNVHTREVLDGVDVAVKAGRIAMFGDAAHTRGPQTRVLDAEGAFLVPGLIDTHMHVESAMVTVTRFAEAVLPHGTTTVLIDNHEIANVLGLDGIRWMLEEGSRLQLKVLLAVPSCVPALPGFEDAGATITPDDIREALGWEGVAGLGEMMNMPGVIESEAATHEMIGAVLEARLPVTGHWSLHGWDDHRLHAYVAAGVDSDHETVLRSDALAKLRAGMWVQLREGSAWHDVEKLAPVLLEDGVDSRHMLLVTDDMHPETLATVGHLNHAVRTAIARGDRPAGGDPDGDGQRGRVHGPPPRRRLDRPGPLRGHPARGGPRADAPAPGAGRRRADRRPRRRPTSTRPGPATRSASRARRRSRTCASAPTAIACRCARSAWSPASWPPSTGSWRRRWSTARCRPIRRSIWPRPRASSATAGRARSASASCRASGCERGAVASTVAHDNHNLFVVGMDDDDMLAAVARLRETGGGMVAVDGGEVIGEVRLPIAGLMSDRSVAEVADEVRGLDRAYKELGCPLEYPFMMVSFLSLGVIPALRLTNRGLVDGREFTLVDPVVT